MSTAVVVTKPFADHAKGDWITDAHQVADVLEHNPHHVVTIIGAEKPREASVEVLSPQPEPAPEASAPPPAEPDEVRIEDAVADEVPAAEALASGSDSRT